MANLWERRQDETPKAFAAFVVYRDLGPARSIVKAIESTGKRTAKVRRWEKWPSRFDWVARAAGYDHCIEAPREP